jgi:hypothetical protein
MLRRLAPESISSASARHPVRTVVVWAVALVLGFMASRARGGGGRSGGDLLLAADEAM